MHLTASSREDGARTLVSYPATLAVRCLILSIAGRAAKIREQHNVCSYVC